MSRYLSLLAAFAFLAGCKSPHPPIATVDRVDLERFMGDWYVIGNIPTFLEKEACNALENYRSNRDGSIDTTFTFNKGALDGPEKKYTPRGFVLDKKSNAVWGMRFVWPFKSDYRIVYLNSDYSQTIVGREARDYVWIMARTPAISDADYQQLLDLVKREGYDTSLVRKVPQRPAGFHAKDQ
jgi:apolipoprotein D and lipocalin family protein